MRSGGGNYTTGNFVVRYDGDVEIYNANRTRAATSVLRQDEIRNESPQYTNIAVGHVVKGTFSIGNDQNVVISELKTSGYLSTSVIRADANRQIRIQTSGTYLVEIGGTIQAGGGLGLNNGFASLRLEEANGSGNFALIANASEIAPANGQGCATLLYKRIITTTQLKKYRFMVNVSQAAATLNTAFISIQRLSN